jgi:hypothetical protein
VSPFIIVLILFEIYFQKTLENEFKQVGFASSQVSLAWEPPHLSVLFFLCKSCPKLKSLGSNFVVVRVGSSGSNLANLFEVDLNRIVFSSSHLLKSVES